MTVSLASSKYITDKIHLCDWASVHYEMRSKILLIKLIIIVPSIPMTCELGISPWSKEQIEVEECCILECRNLHCFRRTHYLPIYLTKLRPNFKLQVSLNVANSYYSTQFSWLGSVFVISSSWERKIAHRSGASENRIQTDIEKGANRMTAHKYITRSFKIFISTTYFNVIKRRKMTWGNEWVNFQNDLLENLK